MTILFAATTLLGALLLFLVEPMVARLLLPVLGGSPAVWNAAVLFFQLILLGGYAWTHLLTTRLSIRRQAMAQGTLLLLSLWTLPIDLGRAGPPPADTHPIPWLLTALTAGVGLPFLALSATTPLLQRWLGSVGSNGMDPYRLSVAGNLGSLVALLAYPLMVEPTLPLARQTHDWAVIYAIFATVMTGCGAWVATRSGSTATVDGPTSRTPIPWTTRLRWLALSAVPSSLMLGVTSHLTQDVTPIPLLWVVPLALYLLTLVLAFGASDTNSGRALWPLLALVVIPALWQVESRTLEPLGLVVLLHLVTFFVAARALHGELARTRPPASQLTEFYLWMSIGGVVGGAVNALAAPLLFDSLAEYPLALLSALALGSAEGWRQTRNAVAVGLAGLAGWWLCRRFQVDDRWIQGAVVAVVPLAALLTWFRSPRRVALAAGPVLVASACLGFDTGVVHRERSFFGLYRVIRTNEDPPWTMLMHGNTLHGLQYRGPDAGLRKEPRSYYSPRGPLGAVFIRDGGRTNVGVIGLGAGCLASYARSGDRYTFFEIDPAVIRLARRSEVFSYLQEAAGTVELVAGDARLTLSQSTERFDVLVIDAFSSDSVPVHLLTQEALADVYLPHLAPGGILLLHVSNRYLDLKRVVVALRDGLGLSARLGQDDVIDWDMGKSNSKWIALARDAADLEFLNGQSLWKPLDAIPTRAMWTDDWSNVLELVTWQRSDDTSETASATGER